MINYMKILEAPDEQTIVSARIFDASIEDIFRAWTDPEHLKNWWGPKGFTNTFEEYDLRPGGKWKFIMHGPDKGNYVNECVFIKIDKPDLIAWDRVSKPVFRVLAQFERVTDGRTRVIFKMIFSSSSKEYETIKKFAPEKNEENFDRLEAELKRMKAPL
jgi:uncharacterized protein YndB with AHSA1/START domain